MLEAYNLSFKEPTNEEEVYDYENSSNEDYYIENDDLSIDLRSKSNIITSSNQNITYYQLLTDLINELSKNRDVSQYNDELDNLKEQNIFGNIKEIEKVIKSVQNVFKELLGDNSKKYLSYSLKIDMNKLLKSFKTNNYEHEIRERIEYIKSLIIENNLSINDYLENLQDIDDINLIYFDISQITEEQQNNFIENIKIGHNTKILLFINMLNMAKNVEEMYSILKNNSTEKFKSFKYDEYGNIIIDKEYGEIRYFWRNNKDKINKIIYADNNYRELQNKLDYYYIMTHSGHVSIEGKNRRLEIFLKMLEQTKTEEELVLLLKENSKEKFKTYTFDENGDAKIDKEYDEIGCFWSNNKDKINSILYSDEQYIELRHKLDYYYMMTFSGHCSKEGKNRRLEIFLKMLEQARTEEDLALLLKENSKEKFKTYTFDENGDAKVDVEYGEIGKFWRDNRTELNNLIYKDINYINLREKLDNYYIMTSSGQRSEEGRNRRLKIFLDMLKMTESEEELALLLKGPTKEKFKTYIYDENGKTMVDKEYGEIGYFGKEHRKAINLLIYKNPEYEYLKEKLDNYYMMTKSGQLSEEGKNRRLEIFLNMLNEAKTEEEIYSLLSQRTKEKFKTYIYDENGNAKVDKEYGSVDRFWKTNKAKLIIPALFYSEEYSSNRYDVARENVMNYLNSLRRKKNQPEFRTIDEYVDTLDKTKKETKVLIELRNSLLLKKEQLIIQNQELSQESNTSIRRAI